MEVSEVLFFKYRRGAKTVYEGIDALLQKLPLREVVNKGDLVTIKAHMGELGNVTHVRPGIVREVVGAVKTAGGRPFVTDTTTLYPEARWTAMESLQTAAANGFTGESMGAPVIIADGLLGYDCTRRPVSKRVDGCDFDEVEVAQSIAESDAMVVVSHAKGHESAGLGGAIKNLGMGCLAKRGKAAVHRANLAEIDLEKCVGCGKCVESCPYGAMRIEGGKARRDIEKCMSCNSCYGDCPNKAMKIPDDANERLQVYLAHAAAAVLEKFDGKACFVNVIQNVTPLCDCYAQPGNPVVADVGILASLDPVAIDKASLDLIDRAELVPGALAEDGPDRLGRINRVDSTIQMCAAEKLGVGKLKYQIIES
jgi:hypothetical protein